MKKLLTAITVLSSIGLSNAGEFRSLRITNMTYPDQFTTITCKDEGCEKMDVKIAGNPGNFLLQRKVVEETIENRRDVGDTNHYSPYEVTNFLTKTIKRNIKEGYNLDGILKVPLIPAAIALDTVGLPISGLSVLISNNADKTDSISDKNAAKKILLNLDSGFDDMIIKHKYYAKIQNYLRMSIVHKDGFYETESQIVHDFANNVYHNCFVRLNVGASYYQNGYNQIYVNSFFKGNYSNVNGTLGFFIPELERLVNEGICEKLN